MSSVSGSNSREILVVAFTCFCRFLKRDFCRKSPISTGTAGRLKPGKFLNISAVKQNKIARNIIALVLGKGVFFLPGAWGDPGVTTINAGTGCTIFGVPFSSRKNILGYQHQLG